MVGKTKARTKADEKRFRAFQEIGCICCRIKGYPKVPVDVHHMKSGDRRIGHQVTLPLCIYHHRGIRPEGIDPDLLLEQLGPSLADGSKPFEAHFGSQTELLYKTDSLLDRRGLR